jgi:hypothetical protein
MVPLPRGFGFNAEGRLFLASGIGPNRKGDNAISSLLLQRIARGHSGMVEHDPDPSPLDLIVAPNGNVIVSSSTRSAPPTRSPPSANMMRKAVGSFAFSPSRSWQRFRSRAGCASVPRAISTAWPWTKWSRLIMRANAVSAPLGVRPLAEVPVGRDRLFRASTIINRLRRLPRNAISSQLYPEDRTHLR